MGNIEDGMAPKLAERPVKGRVRLLRIIEKDDETEDSSRGVEQESVGRLRRRRAGDDCEGLLVNGIALHDMTAVFAPPVALAECKTV